MEPPKPKKGRGPGRPFPKGVSGNPGGKSRTPAEIRSALRDPRLAATWVQKVRAGVEAGDPAMMALYGKHALPAEKEVAVSGELATSAAAPLTTEQLMELATKKGP